MQTGMIRLLVCYLLFFLSGSSLAAVYKWVDEQGQVHYGDKPTVDSSKEISVEQSTTENETRENETAEENDRSEYQKRVLDSMQQERKRKQEIKAREKDDRAKRKQNCQRARKRLQDIVNARYLYKKGDDGEQTVYTEGQRKAATERARAHVKKYCQ